MSEITKSASLPDGWTEVRLADLTGADGVFTDGDWVLKEHLQRLGDDVRLLQLGNLGVGEFRLESERWISTDVAEELGCTLLQPGDVLISRMADPLARAAVLPDLGYPCITAVDVAILRCDSDLVEPRFLMFAMNSPLMRGRAERHATGTTRKRISRTNLGSLLVPLAPRAEQDRIVERFETLDARVREGERSFHEARRLMEQFELTILHAGFSGLLTGHDDDWKRARIGDVVDQCLGKMLDKAKNRGKPRPYLRNVNVQWGRFELGDVKQMRIEDSERTRYGVEPGDLLVCEGGEPGRCAVWTSEGEMYFQKALHRVRPGPEMDVDFLQRYLTYAARLRLLDPYFTGTTIKHLPGEKLRDVPVPMPSRAIQLEIVDAIDAWRSVADRLHAELGQHLTQLRALRSGLLHAAVSGRLVAPDPADEPASELLARLGNGRAGADREIEGATA